jgi:hypothetical protein
MRWADFEEAAPELAALGRERIERFGFVFLGTIRSDGGPRINPVEAHLVEGRAHPRADEGLAQGPRSPA